MTEILGVFTLIGIVLCVCYCLLVEDSLNENTENSTSHLHRKSGDLYQCADEHNCTDYESAHSDFEE